MEINLEGKTVLITGASSGIGQETVRVFAECGCKVLLLDINERGMIDIVKSLDDPCKHEVYVVNIGKKEEIDKFWKELAECPDILVNNAGVYPSQDYLTISEEEYRKTIDINTNSAFWMCRNFINRRGKKGGIIINTSSIEAILPFKEHLMPYGVSKAGVIALTRSIARDFGKNGFRANVVLPGAIKTPGTKSQIINGLTHLRFDLIQTAIDFQHRLALGRWGNPKEVANVILFLASDLASYVQGAMIPVDGGFLSS